MARGEVVLFTGAGFSYSARAVSGRQLPSPAELREILWPLAFPGEQLDQESSLGDVYELAVNRARNAVRDTLQQHLRVDHEKLPDSYRHWFSMPWYRIYTLNVDDLDEAISRKFPLPRRIKSVSAINQSLPRLDGELLSIHLNGRVSDFPDLTFSQRQYGERTARPDAWYQHLVADLASHPVVFVGTQLDEPPLWQNLELRRSRVFGMRELRPGSYLVSPSLSAARRGILREFNVDWVQMEEASFAGEILIAMEESRQRGLQLVSARISEPVSERTLQRIGELRDAPARNDIAEFLLGREPTWADLTQGYAVVREFETNMLSDIETSGARVVLLTGTAGSGKSTTIMRLALTLHAAGRDVTWLNPTTEVAAWEVKTMVKNAAVQVLVIDNADLFGEATGAFLADLANDNPGLLVVASIRSTRYERLRIPEYLKTTPHYQLTVPHLQDQDIELLLNALSKANRLGRLKGLGHQERLAVFKERSGRQLLVAMIEATSGERFETKIDRECQELPPEIGGIYAVACVATSLGHYLTRDELLLSIGTSDNEALNRIQGLLNQRLLVAHGQQISVRHRVIAERAVNYYFRQQQLAEPIRGLAFTMATKVHSERPRLARERKLLSRILNHDWIMRHLSREDVRRVYDQVEDQLTWDYHCWLQRGSFEVETGDLRLAQNFLEQARSLAPDDYLVQTEWAYMSLKRAAQDAPSEDSKERADGAFRELEAAIASRGSADSYPYHVMGSQGLSWVRRAALTRQQKAKVLDRLRDVVAEGVRNHPLERDLMQLGEDLKREYLMLSVGEP
jgi:hypothetical protein